MELEQRLAAANVRMAAAAKALRAKHLGGEWDEYRAARAALLDAERALAASRGDEHAVPLAFPVQWEIGAPMPRVLMNELRTLLIFVVRTLPRQVGDAAVQPA